MSAIAWCAWGEASDVLVVVRRENTSGFAWTAYRQDHVDAGSFGLTAAEARALAVQLLRASGEAEKLQREVERYFAADVIRPGPRATIPGMSDDERARAWWVRTLGYLSPADDLKVESLAREFAEVRAEARKAAGRWYPQHEACATCGHERGRHIDRADVPTSEPCDEDGCSCTAFVPSGRDAYAPAPPKVGSEP